MNFLFLLLVLFSTPVVFARGGGEFLSPREKSEVIRSIDNVCGDTWCEGDYNFKFNNFSCNFQKKSCELTFNFIKSDDQDVETYSTLQTCHFDNITSIKHIRNNRFSLNENFYDKITECIGMLEEKVIF